MFATMRRMPSVSDSNKDCAILPQGLALPITVPRHLRYCHFPVEASRSGMWLNIPGMLVHLCRRRIRETPSRLVTVCPLRYGDQEERVPFSSPRIVETTCRAWLYIAASAYNIRDIEMYWLSNPEKKESGHGNAVIEIVNGESCSTTNNICYQ